MKLISAEFSNFRLLRDLRIEFSTDGQKKLTVIRAANETGKTTALLGLQWGLFGDVALPGGGADFRLHPIDWDATHSPKVDISVTIEFETVEQVPSASGTRENAKRYRVRRSTTETLRGSQHERQPDRVNLWELSELGSKLISSPESQIADELPTELREVFFTDGDRALSFIESNVATATKRDRVEKAIRSLLGLGIVENALKHVKAVETEINRDVRKLKGNADLDTLTENIERVTADIEREKSIRDDAQQQFVTLDGQYADLERQRDALLKKGDKEQLVRERKDAERLLTEARAELERLGREHSRLFRSEALARDLIASSLSPAFERLDDLYDRGKIPNATVPVLEDRLEVGECICGESLNGPGSEARRAHVERLIAQSQQQDEVQKVVTELFFGAKDRFRSTATRTSIWLDAYREVAARRERVDARCEEHGKKLRGLEQQIAQLDDTDLARVREALRTVREQRDRQNERRASALTSLGRLDEERRKLLAERNFLLGKEERGAAVRAGLDVASDVRRVLERTLERITRDELAKVSHQMNSIFLAMIGADPEQGAIIRRAEVTEDFDIVVHGSQDRYLSPDRDLNGASRRALTLAFILALTEVSGTVAPNVIDTPLGMMSGFVKRSVLRSAIERSAQLVLFLTHSEIEGCEALLDEAGGKFITLTNPAHFPIMLKNDPNVVERKVLDCACNHRSFCQRCERLDVEIGGG